MGNYHSSVRKFSQTKNLQTSVGKHLFQRDEFGERIYTCALLAENHVSSRSQKRFAQASPVTLMQMYCAIRFLLINANGDVWTMLLMVCRFYDLLEQDFLIAYHEETSPFPRGMEVALREMVTRLTNDSPGDGGVVTDMDVVLATIKGNCLSLPVGRDETNGFLGRA